MLPPRLSRPAAGGPPGPDDTPCDHLDEILGDYLDALERGCAPPREQFLAAHPELASELAEFLDDEERLDDMMSPLVGASSASGRRRAAPSLQGQTVGAYELVEEVGRGGMGVVYKAHQKGVNRAVALKMLGAGQWATPDDLQRFRLETAAIAELDHPNIVPLYEAGEWQPAGSPTPLPYYTMKWVEGGSLAQRLLAVGHRLPAREAARLLMQVARAVHYAHQRGILHRDLKPANILLQNDERGMINDERISFIVHRSSFIVPMITDFGLAKRLAAAPTMPAPPTLSGTALGTPSYMAPEQVRDARAVTTAADVYSLGAILYECLTGRPPFQCQTGMETLLDVLERDPLPPSRFAPGLDRDLETICLKCLDKAPARRYAGAAALADDLERYLNHEPILARPVGRAERFARWCRRQPLVAGLSAAILLSVVVGVALILVQWRRAETALAEAKNQTERAESERLAAEKARADAEEHRKRAEERKAEAENEKAKAEKARDETDAAYRTAREMVDEFCIRLSEEQLSQHPGLLPLRRQLLDKGLRYYEGFLQRNEKDPRLRLDVAETYFRIGRINGAIGTRRDALRAYERALSLYRQLAAEGPDRLLCERQIGRTLDSMSNLQSALGDFPAAKASLREARSIWERHCKERPNDRAAKAGLSSVLNNERALAGERGAPGGDDPIRTALRVVALNHDLAEKDPDNPDHQASLGLSYHNLGISQQTMGQGEDARKSFETSRQLLDKLVGKHNQPRHRMLLAITLRHLANWHSGRGRTADAMPLYDRAFKLLKELVEKNPEVEEYQSNLAALHSDFGGALSRKGQREQAMAEMRQSLKLRQNLVTRYPGIHSHELALAQSHHNIGNFHLHDGQNAEALASYREAEKVFRKLIEENPDNVSYPNYLGGTLNNAADILQKLGRPAEAMKTFEDAIRFQRSAFDRSPNRPEYRQGLSMLYNNLARAYRLEKRPAEAVLLTLERRKLWSGNPKQLARLPRDFLLAANLAPAASAERRRYTEHALETVAEALAAGYRDVDSLRRDPTLAPLRQLPEFEPLLRKYERK